MKSFLGVLLVGMMLTGCASTHVRLSAAPDDAAIVVDGELKGEGAVKVDVGPEFDFPKSYQVRISRPGYAPLVTTIANKPNYSVIGATLLVDALLAYWAFSNVNSSNPMTRGFFTTFGTLQLISMPLTFFNRNQFEKAYESKLVPEASAAE